MTEFKVGDTVEFIENYGASRQVIKGETGVITRGGYNENLVRVTLDKDGAKAECFGKRLKLHTPAATTFKAGDKVRNTGKGNPGWKGVEGTVVKNDGEAVFGNAEYYLVKITAKPASFLYHSVGSEVRMTDVNMELVEEAAAPVTVKRPLQVGDKVRVATSGNSSWDGIAEGIITERREKTNKVALTKAPKDFFYKVGDIANLMTAHLVVIDNFPRPITFKEIQKGDTLRRTLIKDNGSKLVKEGVVAELDSHNAHDENFYTTLAGDLDDADPSVTLELLARPEP